MSAMVMASLRPPPERGTVKVMFTLTLAVTCCLFSFTTAIKGGIYPVDNWFFVGQTMTVFCQLDNLTSTENGSHMYFSFKDEHSPISPEYVTVVNRRKIRLRYLVTEPFRQQFLGCYLNTTNGTVKIIDSRDVYADYRPKKVKNISCVIHDWKTMTCTWDLGHKHSTNIQTELWWMIEHNTNWTICPHMTGNNCTWSFHNSNLYQLVYLMNISVFSKHPLRQVRNTSKRFRINVTEHVKPAPPDYSIQVINSTCVRVKCELRGDGKATAKMIEYQSEWDRSEHWTSYWDTKYQEGVENPDELEREICGLTPFTSYTVRVAVRYLPFPYQQPYGYPSDWRFDSFRTPPSVPEVAPDMCDSCFTRLPCDSDECHPAVLVYWKAIPKPSRNAIITGYRLKVKSGGSEERSLYVNGSETSCRLELSPEETHSLQLFAITAEGKVSSNYSELFLYPSKNIPELPKRFVVETDTEFAGNWGRTFYLTWSSVRSTAHSYTIFWCRGSKWRMKCDPDDEVHYIAVPENDSQFNLTIPSEEAGRKPDDYLIGLASQVGDNSSGILWSSCFYLKDADPPRVQGVKASPAQTNVEIIWSRQGCYRSPNYFNGDDRGYTTNYIITWCSTLPDDTCSDVKVDQDTDRYTLKGLKAGARYKVNVTAVSRKGRGTSTGIETEIPEEPPTTEDDKLTLAGAVVFALLIVISVPTVSGTVWLIRLYKNKSKKFDSDSSLPQPGDGRAKGMVSQSSPLFMETKILLENDSSRTPLLCKEKESSDDGSISSDHSMTYRQQKTLPYPAWLPHNHGSMSTDQAYGSMPASSEGLQTDLTNSSSSAKQAGRATAQWWASTHVPSVGRDTYVEVVALRGQDSRESLEKDNGSQQTGRSFCPQPPLFVVGQTSYVQASLASQTQQKGKERIITPSLPSSQDVSYVVSDSLLGKNASQNSFVPQEMREQSEGSPGSGSQTNNIGAAISPLFSPGVSPYVPTSSISPSFASSRVFGPPPAQSDRHFMNEQYVSTLPTVVRNTSQLFCTLAPNTPETTPYVPNHLAHEMKSTILLPASSWQNPQNPPYVSIPPSSQNNLQMAYVAR